MVGYLLIMPFLNPRFFSMRNLLGILTAAAMGIPVAIGMQTLFITGLFDLSVGSVAALSSIVTGLLLKSTSNIPLSIVGGMSVGLCFGLMNGVLVTRIKVNALIVTLASMGMARALALGLVGGLVISGYPPAFAFLGQGFIYGVPVSVVVTIALVVVWEFNFRKIRFFRRGYYVGSNEQAALYCGINTSRIIQTSFITSSLGAAFAGILMTSRTMASSPVLYLNLPLEIVGACVIGGASLRGGEGTIVGAVMGLFILIITRNVLVILNVSVYWRQLVIGLILIIALLVDYWSVSGGKKVQRT